MTTATATSGAFYPPLTTTFTPPAECNFPYVVACADPARCSVYAVPYSVCNSRGAAAGDDGPGCYPASVTTHTNLRLPVFTYSPGRVCPAGMTTAASAISPDGVWCCPSSLTWAADPPWCTATLTRGTFMSSGLDCATAPVTVAFGDAAGPDDFFTTATDSMVAAAHTLVPLSFPARDITLTARATAIFLAGQTLSATTAATTASTEGGGGERSSAPTSTSTWGADGRDSSVGEGEGGGGGGDARPTEQSPSSGGSSSDGPSRSAIVGASVGGTLGAILLLLGLGSLFFFYVRRKRRRGNRDEEGSETSGSRRHLFFSPFFSQKAELDAGPGATRSELEGSLAAAAAGFFDGPGLYVRKPELEGTLGAEGQGQGQGGEGGKGRAAVYVKMKAELEGRGRRPWTEVSELEATPVTPAAASELVSPAMPVSESPVVSGRG
ncbi:hypothetical protein AAE478_005481 [Parahypoxylon ruwenzoriense]